MVLQGRCSWSHHGDKHAWHPGLTRELTRKGPARYLKGINVRKLERGTLAGPDRRRGGCPGNSEYAREMGKLIGWDEGEDATVSYVECSGGSATRTFHGRPMRAGNGTLRKLRSSS